MTGVPGLTRERAERLCAAYRHIDSFDLLRAMVEREFPGRIAVVSSFGAEAAVVLDLVAQVDPSTPVIFLQTGKLFAETLPYRARLAKFLGLTDVRDIEPDPAELVPQDPDGSLWWRDPDACCNLRKVRPLERALAGFDAWVTGRKWTQGGLRFSIETVEYVDGRLKINLLATWTRDRVEAAFAARKLLPHLLVGDGYLSIGCKPCTSRIRPGEPLRAGRWRGRDKTECGIHMAPSKKQWPGCAATCIRIREFDGW